MRKVAVVVGRFNPPTLGHQVLVEQLIKTARQHGAQPEIFVVDGSKSKLDRTKNPLEADARAELLRTWFPSVSVDVVDSAYAVVDVLDVQDKRMVAWVAGSDRAANYRKLVASAGLDARVVEVDRNQGKAGDISATAARNAARHGDLDSFARMMPLGMNRVSLERVMALIKQAQDVT